MADPGTVLVLGGTAEGRELADALLARGAEVVSSLAGRVPDPRLPGGEVRIGGFGGADGLAEYLTAHGISTVVDATHPFAAQITRNAAEACAAAGVDLLVLRRPAWTAVSGDRWQHVPDLLGAASALKAFDAESTVFLTTGRQGVKAFRDLPHHFWLRAVHVPDAADLPLRCDVVLDRGPFTLDGERDLLRRKGIDVLVTKNSGGPMTAAKLTAANQLGLPVVMVDRPPLPDGLTTADSVSTALLALGRSQRDVPAGKGPEQPC
ncbi:cobalt-precorrin-6A reductase [Spongisporangium articulatum]|uniref:Cobalt-precorrin-6A reductase n=1 Tax=Spongisporangium articulatum TaxID=3362603 RepID=A0ABW8AKH5_9ACTN